MPQLFQEGLDDPLVFDGQESFVGGMLSNARASSLDQTQASYLQNVICDRPGVVRSRYGIVEVGTFPSTDPGIDYEIAQLLSYLRQGAGQFPILTALTFPDNSGDVTFAKLTGGTWTSVAVVATAGLSAPVGTPTMTQAGDSVYVAIGKTLDLRKWDGTTFSVCTAGAPAKPPAGGIVCYATSRLFIAGLEDEPDAVYIGDIGPVGATLENFGGPGTTAGLSGQVRVGTGADGRIVALLPWTGTNVLVFKQSAIYVIAADPAIPVAEWIIQRITKSVGCIAPRTVAQLGDDVLFLGADGVYSIARVIASEKQGTVNLPISWPIQDRFEVEPFGNTANAIDSLWSAVTYQGRYILATPISFRGVPVPGVLPTPYALVYNQKLEAWEGVWLSDALDGYAFNATCWTLHEDRLYMGCPGPAVRVYADYLGGQQYADYAGGLAEAITKVVRTRGLIFGEPFNPKKGSLCRVEMRDCCTDALVKLYANGYPLPRDTVGTVTISPLPIPPVFKGTIMRTFDLQRFANFNEAIVEVSATAPSSFGLAGIGLGAWLETMPLEKLD